MTLEKNRPDRTDPNPSQGVPALEPLVGGARTKVSAAVARRLFQAAVGRLAITVIEEPTGRRLGQGGPTMHLHRPDEFYARLGRDGLIGFGEAYLTGAWDAEDLAGFLTVPAARMATLIPAPLQKLRAFVTPRLPTHHRSTEENSQANISHHYDLSNDLFELFLDETLSYSSALFDTSAVEAGQAPGSVGDHLVATPPEPTDNPDPAAAPRRLRRGPGTQDRAPARRGRRHGRQPGPGDRHRLGRARDPRGPPRRDRPLHHPVRRAARAGRGPHRGSRLRRPGRGRADGLPRPRRQRPDLRRRRVGRDDRGRGC